MPDERVTTDGDAPVLRVARLDDAPAVERLLASAQLTTLGVAALIVDHAADFVVADDPRTPGELAAVAGLEVCRDNALLRSVAVRPEWRAHGLGAAAVTRLIEHADARGLDALWLLTTTAEHWFPRFGFTRADRREAPAAIAATSEFRGACPASAGAMVRRTGRGFPVQAGGLPPFRDSR